MRVHFHKSSKAEGKLWPRSTEGRLGWYSGHAAQQGDSCTARGFTQIKISNFRNISETYDSVLCQQLGDTRDLGHPRPVTPCFRHKTNWKRCFWKNVNFVSTSSFSFQRIKTQRRCKMALSVSCWQQDISVKYLYGPQWRRECIFYVLHFYFVFCLPLQNCASASA